MKQIWNALVGPEEFFAVENRTFNAVNIVTFLLVIVFWGLSVMNADHTPGWIFAGAIVIQVLLYYFSRALRIFRVPIMIYAASSYIFLIIYFFYEGGIEGPTLFLFFVSFQVLIAFSRKRLRTLWIVMHLLCGTLLILAAYFIPGLTRVLPRTSEARTLDFAAVYIICIVFSFVITRFLRDNYNRQRHLARLREQELMDRNEMLARIAFVHSHEFRAPVANIMQIMDLIRLENFREGDDYMDMLRRSAAQLDEKVRLVVNLTRELDDPAKPD